jgi:hypothetical protein
VKPRGHHSPIATSRLIGIHARIELDLVLGHFGPRVQDGFSAMLFTVGCTLRSSERWR